MSRLRHPVVLLAAVAVVVVGASLAWYLGSPVFLRTELHEPPLTALEPAAAGSAPPTREAVSDEAIAHEAPVDRASAGAASPDPMTDEAMSDEAASAGAEAPAAPAWTPDPPRTGEFSGTDEFHFGRGTAVLREVEPGRWVVRLEDFSVRNGPDLYVVLSPDRKGYTDDSIEVGRLRATDGSFNMRVPEGADVSGVRSVLIWCKQFSHLFAVAPLEG